MRRIVLWIVCLCCSVVSFAQQYTGAGGLIHVPSADMHEEGEARIGMHFLNKAFTPDNLAYGKKKYHTFNHYVAITAFSWLELGYTATLLKSTRYKDGIEDKENSGLYRKDRFITIKAQLLREREGKWWPSVAVGVNDVDFKDFNHFKDEPEKFNQDEFKIGNDFFSNVYVVVSKHFNLRGNDLGVHVAYRDWYRFKNRKWDGPVGGITFQPSFQRNLRFIAEYTGDDVNVGLDWKLWKHWLVQASLQNGKDFSGGICFCLPLL